jgi:hypothetical protein
LRLRQKAEVGQRIDEVGPQPQSFSISGLGGRELALIVKQAGQVKVRFSKAWFHADRSSIAFQRFGDAALPAQHHAEVVVRRGKLGANANGVAVSAFRIRGLAQCLQHRAQRVVGLGKVWRQLKGAAIAPRRLVELTGMAMGVAEVSLKLGLRATKANSRADPFNGLLMLPHLQGDQPQQMGCARVTWLSLKNLPAQAVGLHQISRCMTGESGLKGLRNTEHGVNSVPPGDFKMELFFA